MPPSAAKLPALLAAVLLGAGCHLIAPKSAPAEPPPAPLAEGALVPSPRLIVGRVVALDAERRFAFVELAPDAPSAALQDGAELISRTLDLRETARLRASRYVRGRTLGTQVITGQPTAGDEVVWLAP